MVAWCVLKLIYAEGGKGSALPVTRCTFSKSNVYFRLEGYQPPSEWVHKGPPETDGVLRLDNPRHERNDEVRMQLAKQFLGWEEASEPVSPMRGNNRTMSIIWADTDPKAMMERLFGKLSSAGGMASRVWNQNMAVLSRMGTRVLADE